MNNKGFAISTVIYGMLLMSSVVLMLLITTMSSTKDENDVIYEQLNKDLSDLSLESQKEDNCPVMVRYIEVGANGSNVNTASHIVELQAIDTLGNNVALNKSIVSGNAADNAYYSVFRITDGVTDTASWSGNASRVIVDLGQEYQLDYIQLWRYYGDGRQYYDTYVKTYDETRLRPIYYHHYETNFNNNVIGEYPETSAGKIFATPIIGC